jgi:NADH dehydrogenase
MTPAVQAPRPRIVIVGGGFGGLAAAKALRHANADVTLLDRRNHHLFQPLLYQVATAGLSGPDIAYPIRRILKRQRNTRVLMAEVRRVDRARRVLVLADAEIPYDALILAPGAVDQWFGHDEWTAHAPGLKSLEDALEMRSRMLRAFEGAERETDAAKRAALLTFVVVGGGPTGVELAGTIAEVARTTMAQDFRNFDPRSARVLLVEGSERVLQSFPTELSDAAKHQLERLGVEVVLGRRVEAIDAEGVRIGEERIAARTVLWGAGVRASPLLTTLDVPLDRAGRVPVRDDLSIDGDDRVFVIGDAAAIAVDGKPVPGVAPAAMQMGRHAGENVLRFLRSEPRRAFRYVDKGSLATIGRRSAVADFGRFRCTGFLAWFLWLAIHIVFLIGFRSRFVVLFEWAWAYVTYQRGARVILARGE